MDMIENLKKMLAGGQDNALLRYSLGNAYLKAGQYGEAIVHLAHAVAHDPGYSAAWKLYGKALAAEGRNREAVAVFDKGIGIAEAKGDIQAAKEMKVFRKRAEQAMTH